MRLFYLAGIAFGDQRGLEPHKGPQNEPHWVCSRLHGLEGSSRVALDNHEKKTTRL